MHFDCFAPCEWRSEFDWNLSINIQLLRFPSTSSVPFEMVRYFDQTHATITAQLASRFLIIFGVMINDTHKETLNYDV